MEEILKQITSKLSSYNFFNNLLPGIIFSYLFSAFFDMQILSGEWLKDLFVCYFIGIVISRIGSIFIEPMLKRIRIKNKKTKANHALLNFAQYADYQKALEHSPKLEILLEVSNMYRTLLSMTICLLVSKLYFKIISLLVQNGVFVPNDLAIWIVLIFLVIIFVCSFIKQTNYVRNNIEVYKDKNKDS